MRMFGVELLDGLGTAEMWHIFISNRPGGVVPGTLGRVVDGFDVRLCDAEGRDVADGDAGARAGTGGLCEGAAGALQGAARHRLHGVAAAHASGQSRSRRPGTQRLEA
jgi:hypothetical protein